MFSSFKSAVILSAILLPLFHGSCEIGPLVPRAFSYFLWTVMDDNGGKLQGFTLLRMANGKTIDGAPFSRNTFRAPDDAIVYWTMVHYDSPSDAQKHFDAKVKDAIKLIERNQFLDAQGHVTGQRAVLTYEAKDRKIYGMVLTSASADLRIVESVSLQDALQLDRLREN
jgi:hypothetical protein